MAGLSPVSANEVNGSIGQLLRAFIEMRERVHHFQVALAALDLTAPPYTMSVAEQGDIKSAINGLDASLQAVDMTFINRLVGLF